MISSIQVDVMHLQPAVAAGDVNGDGFADIFVLNFEENTFKVHVIFGRASFAADIDLDTFSTGEQGLLLLHPASAVSTATVSSANDKLPKLLMVSVGDINKDGFEDFIVGSTARSSGNTFSLFVILGRGSFHNSINLSQPLPEAIGFKII
eukprot:gene30977-34961_t